MDDATPRTDPTRAIMGTIRRGFIMRFSPTEQWVSRLVPVLVGEELVDGDAVPYYVQGVDGIFREYYDSYAPKGRTVYMLDEPDGAPNISAP